MSGCSAGSVLDTSSEVSDPVPFARWSLRFQVVLFLGLILAPAAALHATMLGREPVGCPVCMMRFEAVVAVSVDTNGGVDRDLFARSAGPQPVFYHVTTCPRCYYSGCVADFAPGIELPTGFKEKVLKKPKLDPGMTITPQTDPREIPAAVRYRLAVQCYVWRGVKSEAMAWLYLRASWVARDEGSVMPRIDRLQRVMGFVERYLPPDVAGGNQADRQFVLATSVASMLGEGRFTRYQTPYVRFVLAVLYRQRGENDLFEALFPPDKTEAGLPDLLKSRITEIHASIAEERRWQRLALETFLKAVDAREIAPANLAASYYLIAELHRRLGQINRAILYYDRALADPQINAHLARWAQEQKAYAKGSLPR